MNFATLKGLTIPEGNVTKITDALGNVLWNAVRMVNLTITSFWDGMDGDTARITINSPSPFAPNPNEPNNKVTSWTAYVYDLFDQQNRTIKIPVGSTIECYITRDKGNAESHITLNDVKMVTGEGTYIYTVTGDATIDVSEDYIQGDFGVISITGAVTYISFTMNGDAYQAIEGMSWSAWFASSYNTTGETQGTLTDADGNEIDLNTVIMDGDNVLWSAVKPAIITLTKTDTAMPSPYPCVWIIVNGQTYYGDTATPTEISVTVGTKILCCRTTTIPNKPDCTLNGEVVELVSADTYAYYEYTVKGNTAIQVEEFDMGNIFGVFYITEQ